MMNKFECDIKNNFTIKRSKTRTYFDVSILSFDRYQHFLDTFKNDTKINKIVIILCQESPYTVRYALNNFDNKIYRHIFMSYYKSSFLRLPYGNYTMSNKDNYNEQKIKIEYDQRKNELFTAISNCDRTRSNRLNLIQSISELFPTNKYGFCFRSEKLDKKNHEKLFKSHKFFLALENSICPEYVTEKYWLSIIHGAIPIVAAHKESYSSMIPGSYINVYDYDSIKSLINELNNVSTNFYQYKKYFKWKQNYKLLDPSLSACDVLHVVKNSILNPELVDQTINYISNIDSCLNIIDQNIWLRKFLS